MIAPSRAAAWPVWASLTFSVCLKPDREVSVNSVWSNMTSAHEHYTSLAQGIPTAEPLYAPAAVM